jgi:hypothetical protein
MEENMAKLPWWLNVVVKILFVDLFIAFLVLGWSWIAKDFAIVALSNRFFAGGAIAILIGLGSGAGNWGHRSDWQQLYAQSAGQANLAERNARMMADIAQVYALVFVTVPAGLLAIVIAIILGQSA